MTRVQCPACGSDSVETVSIPESYTAPYGPNVNYCVVEHRCLTCDTQGDFLSANDAVIENAIKHSDEESIGRMLSALGERGYSMASIERAFRLPARTLFRWKAEKACSSAGLALLRVVRTYPWLVGVAESGFDPRIASRDLITAACEHASAISNSAGFKIDASADLTPWGAFELRACIRPAEPSCTQGRPSLPPEPPAKSFIA